MPKPPAHRPHVTGRWTSIRSRTSVPPRRSKTPNQNRGYQSSELRAIRLKNIFLTPGVPHREPFFPRALSLRANKSRRRVAKPKTHTMTGPDGLETGEMSIADPGTRQLCSSRPEHSFKSPSIPLTDHGLAESSDEDDQFTDAQSGPQSPRATSPIPTTRVERVDNETLHGEVPGTEAYQNRKLYSQADEIAISTEGDTSEHLATPLATASHHIPLTVVQEAASDRETTTTAANFVSDELKDENRADAAADLIISPDEDVTRVDEDFGDDFDDFEESAHDNDFDGFDDGFQQTLSPAATIAQKFTPHIPSSILPFPIPDFDDLGADEVMSSIDPFLDMLFPPEELDLATPQSLPKDASVFLTPRAAPLWSQLVAPPPLAPPDWIRSRTRRLFLVSLGVPVDLDEILPASKQKKLIFPSLSNPASTTSPRASFDSLSVAQSRHPDANYSPTSVDSQPTALRTRKGPPPQPDLDLAAARHLCMVTDEALRGMTDDELKKYVAKLEFIQDTANELLKYWQERTDEKIGERDAFEGVIESLVKHARKVRK